RGLGRGRGALIPDATTPGRPATERPVDVWFRDQDRVPEAPNTAAGMLDRSLEETEGSVAAEPIEAPAEEPGEETGGNDTPTGGAAGGAPGGSDDRPEAPAATSTEDDLTPVPGASYAEVPVAAIRSNPKQPREIFDEDEMAELVHS